MTIKKTKLFATLFVFFLLCFINDIIAQSSGVYINNTGKLNPPSLTTSGFICEPDLNLYLQNPITNDTTCGTLIPSQQWEDEFQILINDYNAKLQTNKSARSIYTIPIIFHIIHGGEPVGTYPNLPQGQINSQITVLNQDFNGSGYNVSNYPSNAFTNWVVSQALPSANIDSNGRVKIADFGIQFCLATMDTSGNLLAEPGIDRIDFNSKGWSNPNTFTSTSTLSSYLNGTIKPQSIWDVTKYLNIWVSDKNAALMYTGVSSYPPLSGLTGIGGPGVGTDSTDGIWCTAKALGSYSLFPSGIYAATSVAGRTVTHEVGHYLGLRHVWGDGSCATDYCNDTPPAAAQNVGAPTYPLNVGSCSSPSNSPDGEMFMNFMDYPSDPNKYMFTVDQMTRAITTMINSPYRNLLGTHGLCVAAVGINENSIIENYVTVYPNPTSGIVYLNTSKEKIQSVKIYNVTGELMQEFFSPEFSISDFPNGIYFIVILSENSTTATKLIKN